MNQLKKFKELDKEELIQKKKNVRFKQLKKKIKVEHPDIYEFIKLLQMDNRHNL